MMMLLLIILLKFEFSKPIFFVSGLPEMGEMFIDNLMQTTIQNKFESFGIVFLGSTFKRKFASDVLIMDGVKL